MPMPPPASRATRPTVDEWGLYDPERAGLSALYARLSTSRRPAPDETAAAKPDKPAPPLRRTPADR